MNGRIYDPTLGRFLQADPFIQAPNNSQNYNRYSYVLNNPMSYTDPSGFFFNKLFKGLNKAFGKFAPFAGLSLLLIPGVGTWATANWYQAAAFGFASGGVATGSLKGAMVGAFTAVAFQQIGSHFGDKFGSFADATTAGKFQWAGSHALTGGVSSVLNGGKFGHGFVSAGLTKGLNINSVFGEFGSGWDAIRTVTAAIVGGSISKITGGKFANGAITAAAAQAFNGNTEITDPDIGGYSPGAGEYVTDNGGKKEYLTPSQRLGALATNMVGEDGTAYNVNIETGGAETIFASDGITSVCPECYIIPAGLTTRFAVLGREISFGKNFRIAPFGNRTGQKYGRWPHYHRRGIDKNTGSTLPGQGIGRHRPLEIKSTDKSIKDRF